MNTLSKSVLALLLSAAPAYAFAGNTYENDLAAMRQQGYARCSTYKAGYQCEDSSVIPTEAGCTYYFGEMYCKTVAPEKADGTNCHAYKGGSVCDN